MVTLGGPHMGVAASPHCFSGLFCDMINYIIKNLVYFETIQDSIGPAGYFRDPNHLDKYLNDSVFLPYLNNEKHDNYTTSINDRFTSLNGAMLVMFGNDTMIYPKETAWFWEL
jgi:palmitoyl-protein thioesterase